MANCKRCGVKLPFYCDYSYLCKDCQRQVQHEEAIAKAKVDIEQIRFLTEKGRKARDENNAKEKESRTARIMPLLESIYPEITDTIRQKANAGSSSVYIKLSNINDDNAIITQPRRGTLTDLTIPGFNDQKDKDIVLDLIATHYEKEQFTIQRGIDSLYIKWETEQDKAAKEAKLSSMREKVAQVQSALIIGTFISEEGSNGIITNYVMHTVRLTYVDGTKGLITLRETDAFMQALIDKLEN